MNCYGTDEKCDGKHNADIEPCLFWMILIYFVHGKTREPGGLPSVIGGLLDFSKACLSKTGTRHKSNPPDERKEGIANVCYIL
jgi:hypothetical protein